MANYSLDRASSGLVAACQAVARGRNARARVIACCGSMVIAAGLERMTFEVLRTVREHGGRVHCIVNSWENHRIVPFAEEIGATWSTGYYWHRFTRRPNHPLQVLRMGWDIVRTSAGLLRDAIVIRPTHVLVPEYLAAVRNLAALMLLRACGVTIVLRLGNAPDQEPFYRRLWRWIVNPVVDRFVCNSAFTERELLALGIPPAKVGRIYNTAPHRAASLEEMPGRRDETRVVFIGQIIPEKGLDVLLDAVGLLVARNVRVSLDVVGAIGGWISPSYEGFHERVLARASAQDLAGRVRFLGWREDIEQILRGAAVHCMPTQPKQREAFGIVTLEAKLAGIPSVVTPIGAQPELVSHRVDGWIASGADAEAVAEGLEYFLRSPQLAERAGEAARLSAARFTREQFAAQWREVFA
jgi:glycosyltransferase involved in cell wall biosynthesis